MSLHQEQANLERLIFRSLPDFFHPNRRLTNIGVVILVLVIAVYYICVQFLTLDIPYGDEFGCALGWLIQNQTINGCWDKFLHLFNQANEHRVFTFSLAVLTDYSLFGSLNFKRLAWEANLWMIPLFLLINLMNTAGRRNPWLIMPVVLLLFVPQHEITNWPIVGFGAIMQSVLVVASLLLLTRPGAANLTAAILLAAIATFSFGNGMLTFAVGFLILMLKKPKQPGPWIAWTSAMVLAVFLYFVDYDFRGQGGLLSEALRHPLPVFQFFLTFFGSILVAYQSVHLIWITLAGLIPLSALVFLLLFKWRKISSYPVILSVLLFVLLSAAMAAVSRQKFSAIGATAPRYILLQALFLSALYLLYINVYSSKVRWLPVLLLAFGLFHYGGRMSKGIHNLNRHRNLLLELIVAYQTDPSKKVIFGPKPAVIKKILDLSAASGIYTPPPLSSMDTWVIPFSPDVPKDIQGTLNNSTDSIHPPTKK
jgi:hypothetical protein